MTDPRERALTRRRLLRSAALATLPAAVGAACAPPGAEAPPKLDTPAKVLVWARNVQGVWPHMEADFAQLYPRVTVQVEVGSPGGAGAMLTALAAGSGPDAFGSDATPTFMLPYVERDSVLALDTYFGRQANLKKVIGWCRRMATINGKTRAVPFSSAYVGLFANTTVLDRAGIKQVPGTWAGLLDQARTLKAALADRRPSGSGTAPKAEAQAPVPLMLNVPNNAGDFFSLVRAAVLGKAGIEGLLYGSGKWDSAEMILAAETARNLQTASIIPPSPMSDYWVGASNFANGNAAWWPQGTWAVAGFERTKAQNPGQFDFTHFPLPGPKGSTGPRGTTPPQFVGRIVGGFMVNAATKVADAAAVLLDYLIGLPAMQVWIARTPGELPGPVIPFDPGQFDVSPGARLVLETLAKVGDMPWHVPEMLSETLRRYEQDTMMDLFSGKIGPRDYGTLLQERWEQEKREGKLPTQRLTAR